MIDINISNQNKEDREQVKREQLALASQDFKTIVSTVEGRRVMRRFMTECGIYHTTFNGNALNSAFSEGRRSIGLYLLDQFAEFQDLYITLLSEKN